jgi:alkylation response protein AidB-like acyl-CoA dehydrogenase
MDLLDRARELATSLPEHTEAHDRERQLAPDVVAALRGGGFLQVLLPAELGGHALAADRYVEVLATLAAGDAATAWCVMTASTSTLLAGYLDRGEAERLWTGQAPFLAGVFAPGGRARVDRDGVVLSGRWPYASGCRHADWVAVGALLDDGGGPRHVIGFLPADDAALRVVDNWDTLGLRGTGSHDLVADEARLPRARITSVFERTPWLDGPLARVPLFGLLATGVAACGLGVASRAVSTVGAQLAAARESPGSSTLARHGALVARLGAARAYLVDAAARAQRAAEAGPVGGATRGELRLAAAHVAAACVEVARDAFHLGGGAAVRAGHPLQRALRDAEMVLTHRMVAEKVVPAATRAVLGLGPVPPDL